MEQRFVKTVYCDTPVVLDVKKLSVASFTNEKDAIAACVGLSSGSLSEYQFYFADLSVDLAFMPVN